MEGELNASSLDSVPCICATIKSRTNAVVLSENVDEFAFALVAPLRAKNNSEVLIETAT